MNGGAGQRPLDEDLVARDVELELRRCPPSRVGAAVGDPAQRGRLTAQVAPPREGSLVDRKLDAGLARKPRRDPLEDPDQFVRLLGTGVDDREVEVLREAVGLLVTLA